MGYALVLLIFCFAYLMFLFLLNAFEWFIMTVCLFENDDDDDDDDGNASAIFLSPLGLCLYDDIYALLSSSGLISYSSIFCMLLCSTVYSIPYVLFLFLLLRFVITHSCFFVFLES